MVLHRNARHHVETARGEKRWERWSHGRALQHEDRIVDRLELCTCNAPGSRRSCVATSANSPDRGPTHVVGMQNPGGARRGLRVAYDFARGYDFDPERED